MFTAYRKFKTCHNLIGKDLVDIDKFKLVQLQLSVQRDGYNCGVFCLKVCMHVAHTINFIHYILI